MRYVLDGRPVFRTNVPGTYEADVDLRRPGAHRLIAVLEDDKGRTAAKVEKKIIVK